METCSRWAIGEFGKSNTGILSIQFKAISRGSPFFLILVLPPVPGSRKKSRCLQFARSCIAETPVLQIPMNRVGCNMEFESQNNHNIIPFNVMDLVTNSSIQELWERNPVPFEIALFHWFTLLNNMAQIPCLVCSSLAQIPCLCAPI